MGRGRRVFDGSQKSLKGALEGVDMSGVPGFGLARIKQEGMSSPTDRPEAPAWHSLDKEFHGYFEGRFRSFPLRWFRRYFREVWDAALAAEAVRRYRDDIRTVRRK